MKLTLIAAALLLSSSFTHSAETIALWTFNSPAPDDSPSSGTLEPAAGSGTVAAVGGVTSAFVTGDTTNDPAGSLDNSGLNTSHYPVSDASNKTAGLRFSVDTRGFRDITVSWRQRNSGSASRYCRVQHTADGVVFTDGDVFSADADSIFLSREVALPQEAANNSSFAFQVVSEFEESALGYGMLTFRLNRCELQRERTVRFDMVIVSGTRIPDANTPPTISRIGAQTLRVNRTSAPIELTVGDAEDGPDALNVAATSSDESVIPSGRIQLAGQGALRELTVTAGSIPGTAEVTLSVTDQGGRSASTTFTVLVLPENTPPSISVSGRYSCLAGATLDIPFGSTTWKPRAIADFCHVCERSACHTEWYERNRARR
jgi:hypothetical protein